MLEAGIAYYDPIYAAFRFEDNYCNTTEDWYAGNLQHLTPGVHSIEFYLVSKQDTDTHAYNVEMYWAKGCGLGIVDWEGVGVYEDVYRSKAITITQSSQTTTTSTIPISSTTTTTIPTTENCCDKGATQTMRDGWCVYNMKGTTCNMNTCYCQGTVPTTSTTTSTLGTSTSISNCYENTACRTSVGCDGHMVCTPTPICADNPNDGCPGTSTSTLPNCNLNGLCEPPVEQRGACVDCNICDMDGVCESATETVYNCADCGGPTSTTSIPTTTIPQTCGDGYCISPQENVYNCPTDCKDDPDILVIAVVGVFLLAIIYMLKKPSSLQTEQKKRKKNGK